MILSGQSIMERTGMVLPFEVRTKVHGMTFGCGPAGYDVRVAESVVLPPGGFMLASTMEEFLMPTDVLGVVHDKSTLARKGLAVQNTVLEPGWRGFLTLELTSHQPIWKPWRFIRLPAGAPIAQIIFHLLDQPTDMPYAGKYQNQKRGAQKPIMEK